MISDDLPTIFPAADLCLAGGDFGRAGAGDDGRHFGREEDGDGWRRGRDERQQPSVGRVRDTSGPR